MKVRIGLWRRARIAAVVRRRGLRRWAVTSRRAGAGRPLISLRFGRATRPGVYRLKARLSCAGRSQTVFRRVRVVR
jgi:hypothetical protein